MTALADRLRLDTGPLLVAPAVVFLLLFFIYPFAYGFVLSFQPTEGSWLANYSKFFSDEHLWRTLIVTFQLSLPVTILNVGLALPIAFLLTLSYVTGIDPTLARAAATLGAGPWDQFRHIYLPLLAPGLAITFCLAFVQAFSVFPSAVLVGAPSGPTRVISLAAYEAAFEQYDYSMASAVAMIMGFAQLIVVVAVLALRRGLYRGPVGGGNG